MQFRVIVQVRPVVTAPLLRETASLILSSLISPRLVGAIVLWHKVCHARRRISWMAACYDYQVDQQQSAQTYQGISLLFTLVLAVTSLLVAWVMRCYTLTGQKMQWIQQQFARADS